MEILHVAGTGLKLEVEVDYDRSHAELVASLPGLAGEVRRIISEEPNWCILRRRDCPRGTTGVEVILCPSSVEMPALSFLKSSHLRPVFFPEFAAVLTCDQVKELKLPCLGSLWVNHGQKKLLWWEKGSLYVCSHYTPFRGPEFFLPAIAHDYVANLMRMPL